MKEKDYVICWLRRDLRLEDNTALNHALRSGYPVQLLFIFDPNILNELPETDPRVGFIHESLKSMHHALQKSGSGIRIIHDTPLNFWENLNDPSLKAVYVNKDYEPYALERDRKAETLLKNKNLSFHVFKDHVIFEEEEIVKADGAPYTVYTPYKNKWLENFDYDSFKPVTEKNGEFVPFKTEFPSLAQLGFKKSDIKVKPFDLEHLENYAQDRDIPSKDNTSYLSPHLRFGTISVRQVIERIGKGKDVFLSELIWREFFQQILFAFPEVVTNNFHSKYDGIEWRNNEEEFEKWKSGQTGYPMVDAGMRQLNETGYMHNRVRMVTASFLCKHLLIDWRWGEAWFAEKLLDFELASNNGNWQWSAGTGCDAAPYFRIFNPSSQQEKFDPEYKYIRRWVPEFGTKSYPDPIVDHKAARERALKTYKVGIETKSFSS